MNIKRASFYKKLREVFKLRKLEQTQVDGFEAIFDFWENSSMNNLNWLAYILATAWHETGKKMEAVREGFCKTNEGSIRAVTSLFKRKIISRNYALPHANRHSYFGRGLVQITHGYNYERVGKALGYEKALYNNPDMALDLNIAVEILCIGMRDGLFTGKKLLDYFDEGKPPDYKSNCNWTGARMIINGRDKATMIGNYGKKFLKCLEG